MCSRFSLVTTKEVLESEFNITIHHSLRQSYNIAPTHHAYIITNDSQGRIQYVTWGLIPSWSKDGRNTGKLINARCEGITSQTSFRIPVRRQRCLVLADSYYTWVKKGGQQIPFRVKLKEKNLMAMGGIWDVWYKGDYAMKSFSIITIPANEKHQQLNNRMPLILPNEEAQQKWLNQLKLEELNQMFRPLENTSLEMYQISEKINSINHNSNELHKLVS
ncbi:MAG: SOS response-associated peptidase [Bacteroidota bacterium]